MRCSSVLDRISLEGILIKSLLSRAHATSYEYSTKRWD
jgi:hypothetical protein